MVDRTYQKRMKRTGWKPSGWIGKTGETISYSLSVGAGGLVSASISRDTHATGGWRWHITREVKDKEPWHVTPDSAAEAAEYALRKILESALAEISPNRMEKPDVE